MEFSVRHWIPGRVRLHIPALSSTARASSKIVRWLAAQEGIFDARINHACASLIVSYDELRRSMLETMLDYMRCLTPRELAALVAATEQPEDASVPELPPATAPPQDPRAVGAYPPDGFACPGVLRQSCRRSRSTSR